MVLSEIRETTAIASTAVHIHIEGKVQGVGFRPFVYRLAKKYRLKGWVNNGMDGVHIEVAGASKVLERFCSELKTDQPKIATITKFTVSPASKLSYSDFQVTESDDKGNPSVLILPDLDICETCLSELTNPEDRRFNYAFTTCTNCGPRYSIITGLPYDRPNTTMLDFPFCDRCRDEYSNPADRRFYSQTNSCHDCGIHLSLLNVSKEVVARELAAIERAVENILDGKIVAVKGIGGYLLLVDARNDGAVQTLRMRKHRPSKPFALMYANVAEILLDANVKKTELELLQSREKPIVILGIKRGSRRIAPSVAPGQDTLGIMLPYAPLHHLLMLRLQRPVVATSANISGSPILASEAPVFRLLGKVADMFLIHDREIATPQDDSVIRVTPDSQTKIFLRRSRSFAPLLPHNLARLTQNKHILALGAQQKSTISLTHEKNIYVSQYLGDLTDYETELNFTRILDHFKSVLSFNPEFIVVDSHPQYTATLAGEKLAGELNAPCMQVQHHKAHFWAVLAESGLLHSDEPALGVIWDGTGWGEDGAIWGSEFFLFQQGTMKRVAHLNYFPHLLGDKSALEPRLPAFALWRDLSAAPEILKQKFSKTEWQIYETLLRKQKLLRTSSMGRLFDAVASLLGLADKVSFEGEAAMQLEKYARRFHRSENGCASVSRANDYFQFDAAAGTIHFQNMLRQILSDIKNGQSIEKIAFQFHLALSDLIGEVIQKTDARRVAFSGGVFQNGLLVDLLRQNFSDKYHLYFHKHLSPNDENISFGQMICAAYTMGWIHNQRN